MKMTQVGKVAEVREVLTRRIIWSKSELEMLCGVD